MNRFPKGWLLVSLLALLVGCDQKQMIVSESKDDSASGVAPMDSSAVVISSGSLANETSELGEVVGPEEQPVQVAVSGTVMLPLGRAMALNVPLVIHFAASSSSSGNRFQNETLADSNVKTLFTTKKAILLEIDTDVHPDIARQFDVENLPQTVIMTPQGKSAKRLQDFQDAGAFLTAIENVIKDIPNDVASAPRPLSDLVVDERNLKDFFNEDIGKTRMIVILSPS